MEKTILSKKEREDIFELFTKKHTMTFSEIERGLQIRSNHLSYHLDKMVKQGILEKANDLYQLTGEAEKLIPFFAHMVGKEQGPLSIVVCGIVNNDKICLLRREKRPYKGYWGMIGGKLKLDESVKDTALREAKEETGLECSFDKVSAVLHERVKQESDTVHAFIIFLCLLKSEDEKLRYTEEGKAEWFKIDDLPEYIIPSDKFMIQELLENDMCFKDIEIMDSCGELKDMVIKDKL